MKKILIFTDSFLPGFKGGGPITSVSNLVNLLNKDFHILICTRNHDFGKTEPYKDIIYDKITRYHEYNVIYLSKMDKKNISKVIEEFNPNMIYLNSFFSATTQRVMFLNKFYFNKKLVIAPRGELQENALNIKKTKKTLYLFVYKLLRLYKNTYFHSTDEIETNRIKKIFGIENVTELQNAVKIYNFTPLIKKENQLKIIFVSRISRKKNLAFALTLLSSVQYDIIFDIYGPKEDMHYWKECKDIIQHLPKNIKVTYKGNLNQSDVIQKMREYHTFLFPTLSENFGHVIVEAMQAGLIPIISDQTPWRNLDKIDAGWDINLDNKQKYIEVIEKLYLMDTEEYTKKSFNVIQYIHTKLNMKKLSKDYVDLFNQIIGEKNV
jgi:glycosyltransferase involved in cell wall biosynthesis